MEKTYQKFFLGANSAEGFVSHFGDCYIPGSWRVFIIKGGPGTGKSSFMKYVAKKAEDRGYTVTLCPCSSDPNSLDAVIIDEIKTVVLDGTAPHVVEPKLPGACENIINLGEFWDREKLFSLSSDISDAATENSKLHKTASAYIGAAGELLSDNLKLSRLCTDRAAALKFAKKLSDGYIEKREGTSPEEFIRFIGGTTPEGVVSFSKTVTAFYKDVIVIEDKFGGAAGEIMNYLRASAKQKGYDVITLKNPFLPSELIDHVLIPELSLAFVTESEYIKFDTDTRRIHARRFTDGRALKYYRARMLFNRRVSRELLLGAVSTLSRAKAAHDKLEEYYVASMNFSALTCFAESAAEKIL